MSTYWSNMTENITIDERKENSYKAECNNVERFITCENQFKFITDVK